MARQKLLIQQLNQRQLNHQQLSRQRWQFMDKSSRRSIGTNARCPGHQRNQRQSQQEQLMSNQNHISQRIQYNNQRHNGGRNNLCTLHHQVIIRLRHRGLQGVLVVLVVSKVAGEVWHQLFHFIPRNQIQQSLDLVVTIYKFSCNNVWLLILEEWNNVDRMMVVEEQFTKLLSWCQRWPECVQKTILNCGLNCGEVTDDIFIICSWST